MKGHKSGRWSAAVALIVLLLITLVPPAPAFALDDLAAGQSCSATPGSYSPTTCNDVFDGNDTTMWYSSAEGDYQGAVCVDLGAAAELTGFRLYSTGHGERLRAYRINVWSGAACTTLVGAFYEYEDADHSDMEIVEVFDTPLTGRYVSWQNGTDPSTHDGANNPGISTLEVYGAEAPEEVLITEYLYNLRLDHPPFERVISWNWAVDDCVGSWDLTNEGDEQLAGEAGPGGNCAGEFVGDHERVVVPCFIVCGDDVYTITVNDVGNNRVAVYEIDSSESGQLIANSTPPVITSYNVCYNATTDQCVGLRPDLWTAQSSGTLQTSYSFTGDPANVTFGHDDPTAGLWFWSGTPDTVDAQVEGYYRRTYTSVDTDLSPTFNIYFENFAAEYAWLAATVNYGTGGTVEVLPADPDPEPGEIRECSGQGALSLELVACRLGQLYDVLIATFNSAVGNLWGPSIAAMRAAAAEKLPFAYVVLALDGVNDQISRAALEVESTDDCEGVVLTVPLYYGSSNLSASPSPFPITVLNCAGLEPTMGTDWYQAVRTMMDPALWILFGWSQIKALQPKTSLGG